MVSILYWCKKKYFGWLVIKQTYDEIKITEGLK